jgi:hypothetical protein
MAAKAMAANPVNSAARTPEKNEWTLNEEAEIRMCFEVLLCVMRETPSAAS